MARSFHGSRAMLNLPGHHGLAAVVAELRDSEDWSPGDPVASDATFRVSDCGGDISLEMDYTTANGLENSIYKIDTLLSALTGLREGLIVEHHRYQDRVPNIEQTELPWNARNSAGKRSTTYFPKEG